MRAESLMRVLSNTQIEAVFLSLIAWLIGVA